jgi:hypothetical protein
MINMPIRIATNFVSLFNSRMSQGIMGRAPEFVIKNS